MKTGFFFQLPHGHWTYRKGETREKRGPFWVRVQNRVTGFRYEFQNPFAIVRAPFSGNLPEDA